MPSSPGRPAAMADPPNTHAFPVSKLGAFLRAMEDPEGAGSIDPEREREISRIEEQVSGGDDAERR